MNIKNILQFSSLKNVLDLYGLFFESFMLPILSAGVLQSA